MKAQAKGTGSSLNPVSSWPFKSVGTLLPQSVFPPLTVLLRAHQDFVPDCIRQKQVVSSLVAHLSSSTQLSFQMQILTICSCPQCSSASPLLEVETLPLTVVSPVLSLQGLNAYSKFQKIVFYVVSLFIYINY